MIEPDLSGAARELMGLIVVSEALTDYDRVRLAVAVIEEVCSRSRAPTAVRYMAIQRLKSVELAELGLGGEIDSGN